MHVLVIGGSGRTGRHIVAALLASGDSAAVLSRHAAVTAPTDARHYTGSVTDPEAVAVAAAGADGVVVCVESDPSGGGTNGPLAIHRDGIAVVTGAVPAACQIVLISQIYITRPEALPSAAEVIAARGQGEQLLRAAMQPYTILRPGWLTDTPAGGLHLEQGDAADGSVSRAAVAATAVAALQTEAARGVTCELYDQDRLPPDLPAVFARLLKDAA